MTKKSSESSAPEKRVGKKRKPTSDSLIDFSDIPDSSLAELQKAVQARSSNRQQSKKLIAIRLDPQLLEKLRKLAVRKSKPYQTLIHEILEKATKRVA
ncbi:hypothetical protein EBQ90_04075 [bacterium]|nr:hypothetical protein [bacterium]